MSKVWVVLFSALGVLGCVFYVYLANRLCPVEASTLFDRKWQLVADLNKNEKHDRAAYRYGRKKQERHTRSVVFPPSYSLIQKTEAKEDGNYGDDKRNVWLTKFFCDARLSDLLIAAFNFGLFLATAWLVWATLKLWKAGENQIAVALKSANAAEVAANAAQLAATTAVAVELPIVKVSRLDLLQITPGGISPVAIGYPLPQNLQLNLYFLNGGRTPAEAVAQTIEWRVAEGLPDAPVYERDFPFAPGVFLPPNDGPFKSTINNYGISLDDAQRTAINERRSFLWIYGLLSYRDVVTGSLHEYRFCSKWQTFQDSPNAPIGFVHDSRTPPEYTKRT